MQTRKRAKSVTFGKPEKPKEVTHHETVKEKPKEAPILETHEVEEKEHVLSSSLIGDPKTAEKATVVERRVVPDKPLAEDTPAAPPSPPAVTPPNEFLSDSQPSATTITEEGPKPVAVDPNSSVADDSLSPVEPTSEVKAESTSEDELSSTPPPSAFTIQGNNVEAPEAPTEKKKHFVLYFIVIALLAFTLGLGAMAAVSYGFVNVGLPKGFSSNMLSFMHPKPPTPTPSPKPAPTITATPKPVDLKGYTIAVLNGSGVVGKAASVKTTLTTDGFKVGTTGNADRSDYTNTQITVKSSVDKGYVTQLETELKKSFTLDTTSTIPSTSATEPDVTVTIGKAAAK